jgi:4-aminobutyrate aminotransferase-like enzyme
VRGRGLLIGFEMVRDRASLEPATREADQVVNLLRDSHVLVGRDGMHANVLKIRPPMVFRREHADRLVEALDAALEHVAAT